MALYLKLQELFIYFFLKFTSFLKLYFINCLCRIGMCF